MKQTAVEWLIEQLESNIMWMHKAREAVEKAKEMQDEQMQMTWNNAIDAVQKDKWESYDDFYNLNFKAE